jgi:chromosomal replication initiation ATPase DnaA
MSQLTFKFPFKTNYFEEDFYVSTNNFNAYKLIESWPKWSSRYINIYGPPGCGKTHLANIFKKKINSSLLKLRN